MSTSSRSTTSTARVFDIKKMAVHDGPGIRTTVFFKGCPLHCDWCHSPESISGEVELKYVPQLCTNCHTCVNMCPEGCHRIDVSGQHVLDRADCTVCGICAENCAYGALDLVGSDRKLDDILTTILKDKRYFDASGGGVTFSGGEAMLQSDSVLELARRLKENGVHVALDTSGAVPWAAYERVLEYVDLVLFDVKHTDPDLLLIHTGASLTHITAVLHRIDATGTEIVLRCPIVPGINATEEHFGAIGELAETLHGVTAVHVLPFHPFGASKATMVGKAYPLADLPAVEDETADEWVATIQQYTSVPVSRG